MKYLEFTFTLQPANEVNADLLDAVLGEVGFDSFVRDEDETKPVKAYIRKEFFDEAALKAALTDFPMPGVTVDYTYTDAEDKNWNEEWEKNFYQPLVVDDLCVVHSTFHKDVPTAKYDIIINPQMSFGTGHHATTTQMIQEILHHDMTGAKILDMGCGTSILAILARMCGAAHCTAIDNDEWCVKNSLENIELNHVDHIDVALGDASALPGKGPFNFIIANINRNILLADMPTYVKELADGGKLFMSGFYVEDVPLIRERAESLGLRFVKAHDIDRWACVVFEK